MHNSELNSFKLREKRFLRKKRGLVREIESAWHCEVPMRAQKAIPWMVLGSIVTNLTPLLEPASEKMLRAACEGRKVSEILKWGATFAVPQKHESASSYLAASVVFNLFKKFPWTDADLDPQAKALNRFEAAELQCRNANKRLTHYRSTDFCFRPLVKRLDVHQIFHLARRKIQSWLGECEPENIFQHIKFGPGGVVGLKRPFTTPYYKLASQTYTVSAGAYFHALKTVASCDSWFRSLALEANLVDWGHNVSCTPLDSKIHLVDKSMKIANYNEITFVPKDATTLRSIAIEPHLNVVLQLAAGTHIRACLKRAGCDLNDQSRNQELARIGSLPGSDQYDPVTIDLAMASDTLCIELVRELLPHEWFKFLNDLRSWEGKLRGKNRRWEKFSSMGNGFTFELESLIFYALSLSVAEHDGTTRWFADTFGPAYKTAYVSVYGDDIIVPARCSAHLIDLLRFCGFRTNLDKTFTVGPFRESCGKDYFGGVSVRPFYMKRPLSQQKDLIYLSNRLRGLIEDYQLPLQETVRLVDSLLDGVLEKHLRGPLRTDGDQCLWREPDACHSSYLVVWDTEMQTWLFPQMQPITATYRGRMNWRYCQFLYANTGNTGASYTSSTGPDISLNGYSQDNFSLHRSGGGSAGEVTRSGRQSNGRIRLIS